ncbi:MAG: flagellar basal body P-ring protein FlgI [Planctomycetaceae bacterium]|nr:flagellar basal body P-ring protein FlgI [Planctomycetaceae bacterium]
MKKLLAIFCLTTLLAASDVAAAVRLKDIARVKGQESNSLQGLGLVVGLKGTGDGGKYLPTIRSLATVMQYMRNPALNGPDELRDASNVALVMVTATVPPGGARQGDQLDCQVSSIGAAKSLAGGRLFLAALQGPDIDNARVYAFCEGLVHLDDPATPTVGRIHGGCRMEEDLFNPFIEQDKMTVVLDKNHADFEVAQEVAEVINSQLSIQSGENTPAKALNSQNIVISVPQQYRDDYVLFVSQIMSLSMPEPAVESRVVINERSGSIVIGGDVEIGAVVVSHKNVVIETEGVLPVERFTPVDVGGAQGTKLKALVSALQAVKVPTEDIIDIIKGLDRNGKLHGRLIIE